MLKKTFQIIFFQIYFINKKQSIDKEKSSFITCWQTLINARNLWENMPSCHSARDMPLKTVTISLRSNDIWPAQSSLPHKFIFRYLQDFISCLFLHSVCWLMPVNCSALSGVISRGRSAASYAHCVRLQVFFRPFGRDGCANDGGDRMGEDVGDVRTFQGIWRKWLRNVMMVL